MAYQDDEISEHGGSIVELFRYRGTYVNFYYTSGPVPVMFQADDDDEAMEYVPINMTRTQLNVTTQNDDVNDITIEMPVSTPLVTIYGFQIAPPDLECTIFRQQPTGFIRYWSGPVENVNVIKGTASIRIPSRLSAVLQADMPNVFYQTPCNNSLYDEVCQVPEEAWTWVGEISDINGRVIHLDHSLDLGPFDGTILDGGEAVLASGERRMITDQFGHNIYLNFPFSAGAQIGDEVTLRAGCNLAYAGDCKNKFDNTRRHTGFPFIPPANVFNVGLEPGKIAISDLTCEPIYVCEGPWAIRYEINRPTGGYFGAPWPAMLISTIDPNGSIDNSMIGGYMPYQPIPVVDTEGQERMWGGGWIDGAHFGPLMEIGNPVPIHNAYPQSTSAGNNPPGGPNPGIQKFARAQMCMNFARPTQDLRFSVELQFGAGMVPSPFTELRFYVVNNLTGEESFLPIANWPGGVGIVIGLWPSIYLFDLPGSVAADS